jgi:hypothetical protein
MLYQEYYVGLGEGITPVFLNLRHGLLHVPIAFSWRRQRNTHWTG